MFAYTRGSKFLNRSALRLTCAASFSIAALIVTPTHAFTLDGVVSSDDSYTEVFDLNFSLEGGGNPSPGSASGTLRVGRDGAGGDVFMLIEIPVTVTDNVYGTPADNPLSGWGNGHKFSDLAESDKLEFELSVGGDTHQIALDYIGNVAELGYATSLQYNLANSFGDTTNSPDPIGGTPPDGWVQEAIYELQVPGSLFAPDETITGEDIAKVVVHSSPAKDESETGANVACTGNCTAASVPEPGTLALLGAGLIGLAYLRRRRAADGANA